MNRCLLSCFYPAENICTRTMKWVPSSFLEFLSSVTSIYRCGLFMPNELRLMDNLTKCALKADVSKGIMMEIAACMSELLYSLFTPWPLICINKERVLLTLFVVVKQQYASVFRTCYQKIWRRLRRVSELNVKEVQLGAIPANWSLSSLFVLNGSAISLFVMLIYFYCYLYSKDHVCL